MITFWAAAFGDVLRARSVEEGEDDGVDDGVDVRRPETGGEYGGEITEENRNPRFGCHGESHGAG